MIDEQRRRLEALPGWTYAPPTESAWEAGLKGLAAFAARTGHCRLPTGQREGGVDIDSWAARQRSRFHRGQLRADRVQRLEAVPGWSWTPTDAAWEAGYVALVAHVDAEGTALVRRDLVVDGYPVGAWVGEQRARYSEGQLLPERRERLEVLPGWAWNRHADSWERHHAVLLEFVEREGHARVPTDHVEDGLPLAAWVIRHRQDHKAGKVPQDRAERLEALPGWTWDVLAARWEEHFAGLQAYAAREGHARVPTGHLEEGLKLGSWVIVQRQAHRRDVLTAERTARLEAVAGWVWVARTRGRRAQQT
jgi:hypothetical protein